MKEIRMLCADCGNDYFFVIKEEGEDGTNYYEECTVCGCRNQTEKVTK